MVLTLVFLHNPLKEEVILVPKEEAKSIPRPIQTARQFFTPPTGKVLGLIERASLETGISTTTLSRIAWCESRYRQTATHINSNNSMDVGLWQLNDVHFAEAKRLGLDIKNSAEDNTTFAIILLKKYGTKPWVCKG